MNIEQKLGPRLKALREARQLSQDQLAPVYGVNDRQTVSQIETGNRRLSAVELVRVAQFFGVSLDDLSNPFLLGSSKASFSWRQTGVRTADLNSFELRAGEWIGAYRELSGATGQRLRTILPRVGLTYQSSYEDAIRAGEDVALEFDLGDVPARRLAETMERELGILVLMVEAIQGVSGAACRLPELNVVLINRHESEVRRHFDLAHELFHILTWDTMPPERVECAEPGEAKIAPATARERRLARIEQLANNFAAGVLMPGPALDKQGAPHGDLVVWLDAAAAILGVSGPALKYRLLNAGRIAAEAKRIPDSALIQVARERQLPPPPVPFGESFLKTIAKAIEGGHLSARRAAGLLDTTTDDLGAWCDALKIGRPAEL